MKYNLQFSKYQGCGNDFIVIDETDGRITPDKVRGRLATLLCDRHFQIGADGILFVERAKGADGSMRLFEPDGKEADMCGNGIRCVAAHVSDRLGKDSVDILTRDGMKHIDRIGGQYLVDMGVIRTRRADLRQYVSDRGRPSDSLLDLTVNVGKRSLHCAMVNSGEPHLVTRTNSLDTEDVESIGNTIKKDRARFPRGTNINFVQTIGPHKIKVRTYERGVYYETLACGTGATASAAVALMKSWVKPGTVHVQVSGGSISIDLDKNARAFMTGPAVKVYRGQLEVKV